jgi:hypothetical protein
MSARSGKSQQQQSHDQELEGKGGEEEAQDE